MAITFTPSNHWKYQLLVKLVDLGADSIKAVLCKSGFTFSPDFYASYANMHATSGSLSIVFDSAAKTLTRTTGSFVTNGFVEDSDITTTSGLNPGPFTLTTVTALILTVSETVVAQTISCVIASDDELATSGGYTKNDKTLSGVSIDEDDAGDRCRLTCNDLSWTGSGDGFISSGCILLDDTPAVDADKTILGYLDFDVERTTATGMLLAISDIILDITGTASGTGLTVTLSNHYLFQMANKELEINDDDLKLILMESGFTFNKDDDATYASISAEELAAGNGYTQNNISLANPVATEDDTSNLAKVKFDPVVISASGGAIGPTPGFIIYDDTSSDNTVVGYWKFPLESTTDDGKALTIVGITIENI